MRLAIVAPQFQEYSLRYAMGMAPLCEVLVCLDQDQLAVEYADRVLPSPVGGRLERFRFKTPLDLLLLLRCVRRFRPDVVHIQEAAGPRRAMFTTALAWLLRRSALIVLTVHDPLPHTGRDQATARRTAAVAARTRHLTDVLVAHGAYCAALVHTHIARDLQRVVTSAHGLILEPETLRPPPGLPLRLYFFGRMEAYKGVEVLLEAVEALHAERFPFRLFIAGSGPELVRLRERFERLPEVEVFAGFVPPLRVIEQIQDAECILLPYLDATQSGVLAAAFAGRRCVIATDTGGLPDVVTHRQNGLLIPPGDAAALTHAIRTLAGDAGLRARLREGAQRTAEGPLNWDTICRELHAVFAAAAGARAHRLRPPTRPFSRTGSGPG